MDNDEDAPRTTCPGGYDYAGHVCDASGCPDGYPRLTESGWQVSA
jgi:hypothetical protein